MVVDVAAGVVLARRRRDGAVVPDLGSGIREEDPRNSTVGVVDVSGRALRLDL